MGCGCSQAAKVLSVQAVDASRFADVLCLSSNSSSFHKKYSLGEVLGVGSSGKVRKACLRADPSQLRAVKVIERGPEAKGKASETAEVRLLLHIWHVNIANLYDFYDHAGCAHIVLEYCSGGDMYRWLQEHERCDEQGTHSVGRQIVFGLEYIHSMRIVHRDVKAENVMLAGASIMSRAKLTDFGLACGFAEGEYLTRTCGSIHYIPPEVIMLKEYQCEVDLWAFGVLLYWLLYQHYPHDGREFDEIALNTVEQAIEWQTTATLRSTCIDFLQQLLNPNQLQRISARDAVKHLWIAGTSTSEPTRISLPYSVDRSLSAT
eukprot:TRINITY_DN4713_c0_g1_i1.p1 TRINITY_DN4713_c0_g1~~TRINITY_DN4713_c0_g1_i1.p1  ORF type:complete len:343 (-),score=53.10 TRINITY_DN4713_c0_g1_i1:51-1007(-)